MAGSKHLQLWGPRVCRKYVGFRLWWKPKSWNVQTQISCTVFGGDFDPFQVSKIPSFLNSNFGVHSNFGFRFKLGIYVQWKAQESTMPNLKSFVKKALSKGAHTNFFEEAKFDTPSEKEK